MSGCDYLPSLPGVGIKRAHGGGLHSFTSQLNFSAFYGIGGARRGCVARVRGCSGCVGCFCVSDTAQVEQK
jgi:hypothetical protein